MVGNGESAVLRDLCVFMDQGQGRGSHAQLFQPGFWVYIRGAAPREDKEAAPSKSLQPLSAVSTVASQTCVLFHRKHHL